MRTLLAIFIVLAVSTATLAPAASLEPAARSAGGRVDAESDVATAGSPAASAPAGAHGFGPVVLMNDFDFGGEPGIDVAPDGTLYENAPSGLPDAGGSWVYKSTDGGATWRPCAQTRGIGGGDSNIAINPDGVIVMNDLWIGSLSVSVSRDGCASWIPVPITTTYVGGDRQWIEYGQGDCEFFQSWNQLVSGVRVMHSIDCGLTWVDALAIGGVDLIGNLVSDHSGATRNTYQFYTVNGQIRVATIQTRVLAGVETPLLTSFDRLVAPAVAGHTVWDSFPAGAVDAAGHVHAVWQDRAGSGASATSRILYAKSTDGGVTWTPAKAISSGGSNVFPWIDAGAGGKANAVWYHSDVPGQPDVVSGPWFVHMAQTLDDGATWTESRATPKSIHNDVICTSGTGCGSDDRDLLDFFEVAHDAAGYAVIALAKDTDANGNGNGSPRNAFVRQVSGPAIA